MAVAPYLKEREALFPPDADMPSMASTDNQPDADLPDARAAAQGDHRAFERLHRRHAARIRTTAEWLLGANDIDEVVQDVFVRIWEQLRGFSGSGSFRAWSGRVAVTVILRYREVRGRTLHRNEPLSPDRPTLSASTQVRVEIEDAVARLPRRAREVFVLHDMHGFTPIEIAGMLGVTLNTVRSQIARSRLRLRRFLSDND